MLFLFGDTESSESRDPDLATEGTGGKGGSSGLGRKDGIRSSLRCCCDTCAGSEPEFLSQGPVAALGSAHSTLAEVSCGGGIQPGVYPFPWMPRAPATEGSRTSAQPPRGTGDSAADISSDPLLRCFRYRMSAPRRIHSACGRQRRKEPPTPWRKGLLG